jgi:hypothetical protein
MKKGLLTIALVLSGVKFGYSQINSIAQAQTIYIYNFSRMIQWPASSQAGDFIIGVVGDNELYNYLVSYMKSKMVGSQPITVKKFENAESISKCHIMFVGDGKVAHFNAVLKKLQDSHSLIITEKKGMIESGSAIDFFLDEDKLKFVMNSGNAEKYNLTVSKSLVDMAQN